MLARFERVLEQALEGSLQRVFPRELQPVQLAKMAARAMEEAQVVGVRGAEVPNDYTIRLSSADLARFSSYRATLERELATYLADYAHDRGLHPVDEPKVALVEDPAIGASQARVDARFLDIEPAHQEQLERELEGTRALRLDPRGPARQRGAAIEHYLVDSNGTPFHLDPQTSVVRVGRALDNDVCLVNDRVSRYHAQLRWERGNWMVYDLQSTNGTYVDGVRVSARPVPLGSGATLRLGDEDLAYSAA